MKINPDLEIEIHFTKYEQYILLILDDEEIARVLLNDGEDTSILTRRNDDAAE